MKIGIIRRMPLHKRKATPKAWLKEKGFLTDFYIDQVLDDDRNNLVSYAEALYNRGDPRMLPEDHKPVYIMEHVGNTPIKDMFAKAASQGKKAMVVFDVRAKEEIRDESQTSFAMVLEADTYYLKTGHVKPISDFILAS